MLEMGQMLSAVACQENGLLYSCNWDVIGWGGPIGWLRLAVILDW